VNPLFLSLEDVLALHQDQIAHYGGSLGIRDMGLLLSAVEMPKASFGGEFLHENIYEMGAAYLFHIVQNHPFVDGNKRAGLASAIAFLRFNGHKLIVDQDLLTEMVLEVAQGYLGKSKIADFLRRYARLDELGSR
jgi:death-on-curing protein